MEEPKISESSNNSTKHKLVSEERKDGMSEKTEVKTEPKETLKEEKKETKQIEEERKNQKDSKRENGTGGKTILYDSSDKHDVETMDKEREDELVSILSNTVLLPEA